MYIPDNIETPTEVIAPTFTDPASAKEPRQNRRMIKIAIALACAVALAFAVLFGLGVFKTPEERLADFRGTWHIEALTNDVHPLSSLVGSHLAVGTAGINQQMKIGILDGKAQLVVLGNPEDFTAALQGDKLVMTSTEDGDAFEAAVMFGKLFLTDKAAGTTAVYSKIADIYTWQEQMEVEDVHALMETAASIGQMAGADTSQMEEYVSAEELAYHLDRADPSSVQQALSNIDMTAIVSGHPENAIDIKDPAVKEVVSSVDVDAIYNDHPEAADYMSRDEVEEIINRYEAGEFQSISEISSIFQSGVYEQSLMSSNMQEQG